MASFENKVVAITGGASGIGLATAKLLASRGAIVSIADVSKPNLEKAAAEIKEQSSSKADVQAVRCDVRNPAQLDFWIEQIVKTHGRLDCAANIAGVLGKGTITKKIHEIEQDEWDQTIGINLTGIMNSLRAELKVMKSGATIVNAGSAAGFHGSIGAAAYCASKHGVHGLTKVAAKEYGPTGIRINAVAPGFIYTPLQEDVFASAGKENIEKAVEAMPMPRFGTPEEVASTVVYLLSEESSFMTGAIVSVDGGWHT